MSYFHFYWANLKSPKAFFKSTLPPKTLLMNLFQWRTVLVPGEILPLLWVNQSVFTEIRQKHTCYDLACTNLEQLLPPSWLPAWKELRAEITPGDGQKLNDVCTYWRTRIPDSHEHSGYVPCEILVVNIEQYLTNMQVHNELAYKLLVGHFIVLNKYELYALTKDEYINFLLPRLPGIYLDMDIKPKNNNFYLTMSALYQRIITWPLAESERQQLFFQLSYPHPTVSSYHRTDVGMLMYFGDKQTLNPIKPHSISIGAHMWQYNQVNDELRTYSILRQQSYAQVLKKMTFADKAKYRDAYRRSSFLLASQLREEAKEMGKPSLLTSSDSLSVWGYLQQINQHLFGKVIGRTISSKLPFYRQYLANFSTVMYPLLELPDDVISSTVSMYGLHVIAAETKAEDTLIKTVRRRFERGQSVKTGQ